MAIANARLTCVDDTDDTAPRPRGLGAWDWEAVTQREALKFLDRTGAAGSTQTMSTGAVSPSSSSWPVRGPRSDPSGAHVSRPPEGNGETTIRMAALQPSPYQS